MIPIEKQVASFKLCKKLKDLGMKQESFFYWFERDSGPSLGYLNRGEWRPNIAAFTVAELGEMLPEMFYSGKIFRDEKMQWWGRVGRFITSTLRETEADARAEMLIYLIEQGSVKP